MDKNSSIKESVSERLSGLDAFISSKTTVGDPIRVGEKIIIPLMDVKLGVGAGAYSGKANGSAGGMGATMEPSSVIIVDKDSVRLMRIQNDDAMVKIIDMVPEVMGRIKDRLTKNDKDVEEAMKNRAENDFE